MKPASPLDTFSDAAINSFGSDEKGAASHGSDAKRTLPQRLITAAKTATRRRKTKCMESPDDKLLGPTGDGSTQPPGVISQLPRMPFEIEATRAGGPSEAGDDGEPSRCSN